MGNNKKISAFAFNVGEQIENLIVQETDNLKERNQILEGKILEWYQRTKDKKFADHFGITTFGKGRT